METLPQSILEWIVKQDYQKWVAVSAALVTIRGFLMTTKRLTRQQKENSFMSFQTRTFRRN